MKFLHIVDSRLGDICINNLIKVVFFNEEKVNIDQFWQILVDRHRLSKPRNT